MSSARGNVARRRPQKHQNIVAFKNDKYNTNEKLKKINAKEHSGVCRHCKEVLEWKIKYSKYKPLTLARKCVKCLQKTVKEPYHVMCKPCALKLELCAKCGKKEEIVILPTSITENEHDETSPGTKQQGRSTQEEKDDECEFDSDGIEEKDEIQSDKLVAPKERTDTALQEDVLHETEVSETQELPDFTALHLTTSGDKPSE
uniref:Uncharacterized protein n=1 Tax=Callorhinchus milii TaxID=7868 RepID=V9LC88_CALMI